MTVAEALDRIYAAGIALRVEGTELKARGDLNPAQRAWLKANKLRVISEIQTPSRCSCGQPVAQYGVYDGGLLPYCEDHIPPEELAQTWPANQVGDAA